MKVVSDFLQKIIDANFQKEENKFFEAQQYNSHFYNMSESCTFCLSSSFACHRRICIVRGISIELVPGIPSNSITEFGRDK